MTADDSRFLERLTIVAPFGIRFKDAVTGTIIDDGLSVVAHPPDNPSRRIEAIANRNGVYVFHGLPGMRDIEYPAGDEDPLDDYPERWSLVVEVTDTQKRFIPVILNVRVPVRGLFRWEPGSVSSPPSRESPVVLYSAPTRPVRSPMAVVRGELRDPLLKRPACWAVIECLIDGVVQGRGISDALGKFLVMFPYPEPKDSPASPPHPSPKRLFDRIWMLQLRAFYTPDSAVSQIPDLKKTLEQTPATLWSALSPAVPLGQQTLKYGSELLIASQSKSELLITPT